MVTVFAVLLAFVLTSVFMRSTGLLEAAAFGGSDTAMAEFLEVSRPYASKHLRGTRQLPTHTTAKLIVFFSY